MRLLKITTAPLKKTTETRKPLPEATLKALSLASTPGTRVDKPPPSSSEQRDLRLGHVLAEPGRLCKRWFAQEMALQKGNRKNTGKLRKSVDNHWKIEKTLEKLRKSVQSLEKPVRKNHLDTRKPERTPGARVELAASFSPLLLCKMETASNEVLQGPA